MEKDQFFELNQQYFNTGVMPTELSKLLKQNAAGIVNLYQEMQMRSRYVDTQRDTGAWSDIVQLHSHTFFEIICCYQGGTQYLLGANRYRIGVGDIVIIPPGVSHRPLSSPDVAQDYLRYVVWLSVEFANDLNRRYRLLPLGSKVQPCVLRTSGTQWEQLRSLFANGVAEAEGGAQGWEAAVLGNTMLLTVQLSRLMSERGTLPAAESPELLDRVLAYIEAHLADKITLKDTARFFLVSASTIRQLFHRRLGVSFYRCVTQRRLIEAKARIGAGEALEKVAMDVGFGDYSAFYRAFKQEYGISPSQYRQL